MKNKNHSFVQMKNVGNRKEKRQNTKSSADSLSEKELDKIENQHEWWNKGYDTGYKKAIDDVSKTINSLEHSGWISKDLLYDRYKGDEDICVVDFGEIVDKINKLKEKQNGK